MDRQIFAGASFESEKFFFEQEYSHIPQGIKDEIKVICVTVAHKLECTFLMGFHEDGDVFFEVVKPENAFDFDDIGVELEIKELKKQKAELLKALNLWYKIFKTDEGEEIKKQLLSQE